MLLCLQLLGRTSNEEVSRYGIRLVGSVSVSHRYLVADGTIHLYLEAAGAISLDDTLDGSADGICYQSTGFYCSI